VLFFNDIFYVENAGLSDFLAVILEKNPWKEKSVEDSFESSIGNSLLWKSYPIRRWDPWTKS